MIVSENSFVFDPCSTKFYDDTKPHYRSLAIYAMQYGVGETKITRATSVISDK